MFQASSSLNLPSEYSHQEFRTRVGILSIQQYTNLQKKINLSAICRLYFVIRESVRKRDTPTTYSPNPPSEWTHQNLNILLKFKYTTGGSTNAVYIILKFEIVSFESKF